MNPDAQIYLADQLALIRDGLPMRDERTPEEKRRAFSVFTSALQALKAVGAVEDSEIHDWSNRCLVALGEDPLEPIVSRPGRAVMRFVSFRDGPPPEVVPPPLPEFIRLVPASTPAQATRHGGRFQVLGVEIYDTELAVAWRLAPLPSEESMSREQLDELDVDTEGLSEDVREVMRLGVLERRRMHAPTCEVSDDAGTAYRPLGGGSGGGGDQRVGRTRYAPAPPPEATRLIVRWEDVSHFVPLPSD
jgi:hypothetical protein